jgi:hypothetical protein
MVQLRKFHSISFLKNGSATIECNYQSRDGYLPVFFRSESTITPEQIRDLCSYLKES